MKTIQKGNEILRVQNDEVDSKLGSGWKLIAKKLWKENVRGPLKTKTSEKAKEKEISKKV